MENQKTTASWSTPKKIGFRFVFIFFALFIITTNNGAYPFWQLIFEYPSQLLQVLIPWVGKHILELPYDITVFVSGSGDTTYDWVILFCITMIAIGGTLIWTLLDRHRLNYEKLYYWLTVAIRFYVGLMLIHYGLIKVIRLQFAAPGLARLAQNYGDSSPMGLAWTFLGYSKGYNLFMGLAEVSAVLLLFRRTMTFGAVITLMTTANVMAVNYFYDVPVKIVSTALVVMTLFLLSHDIKRLLKFFFTGEAVALPVIKAPVFKKRWLRISKLALKTLIVGYTFVYGIISVHRSSKLYGDNAPKPELYGLYQVDTFVVNKDTIPPLLTDTLRWKQFSIEREGFGRIHHMTDRATWVITKLDTLDQKIDLTIYQDSTNRYSMSYDLPSPKELQLKGTHENDSIFIKMKRKGPEDFLLMNRGFHWISEYPFNR